MSPYFQLKSKVEELKLKHSKYFIGNTTHCNLYGYGDGVEEIRRAIDNMSSDEVEQT